MARNCSACAHSAHHALDRLLVEGGESLRSIARRHGLSKDSLRRHRESHLQKSLVKAQEIREVEHADDLLGRIRALEKRTMDILEKAEASGDLRTAITAIREARGCMELVGKATGELVERHAHLHAVGPAPPEIWLEITSSLRGLAENLKASSAHSIEDHLYEGRDALPTVVDD